MSDDKSLIKISNKYLCIASGEKRMSPCGGCQNPQACLSRAMQYKETEEMSQPEEKAILKINADGGVLSCAKGLDSDECGYKGGKVCGACGALAVDAKAVSEDDEEMLEDEDSLDAKAGKRMDVDAELTEEEDDEDEDEDEDEEELGEKGMATAYARRAITNRPRRALRKRRRRKDEETDEMLDDEMLDDEEDEEMSVGDGKGKKAAMADQVPAAEEDEDGMDVPEKGFAGMGMMKPNRAARRRGLRRAAGQKADSIEDLETHYICQFDRKVYPDNHSVCANCPGGCAPEDGMPGIADVEGMALGLFGGKVLGSGYAEDADLFVVDLLAKDGNAVEIIADGSTGELLNFHRLNTPDLLEGISGKSLEDGDMQPVFVDVVTAQELAMKSLEAETGFGGTVLQADSDIFEGFDSYVFEIDGLNGKSYDVFVALDGTVLGFDEYDASEAEDIEAEAAELALKRQYSDDERESMAESGLALPDGSYPIKDVEDLRNAIQAFGRAKDKERAKAHIIKRAMDLGEEDLIPMNWVPKKIQEEASGGEKVLADSEFLKSLMEFEIIATEEEIKDIQ